jgi:cytochrome b involved in lipid metabolism
MKNILPIIGILVVIAIIAVLFVMEPQDSTPAVTNDDTSISNSQISDSHTQGSETYTLDEVAEHSTADDCWMVLSGKVYDFTAYIASQNHPGGATILGGCGTDATTLFETRPMGSETPHSQGARASHDDYYLGDLE